MKKRMKKQTLLAFAAGLLLCILPARADYPEDFDYEMDFQYMFQTGVDFRYVQRSDLGYYFDGYGILFFAPHDLSYVVPLCGRPEC